MDGVPTWTAYDTGVLLALLAVVGFIYTLCFSNYRGERSFLAGFTSCFLAVLSALCFALYIWEGK